MSDPMTATPGPVVREGDEVLQQPADNSTTADPAAVANNYTWQAGVQHALDVSRAFVGHSVRALIAELEHLVAHPERANQPARPRTVMIDKRPDTPGTEVAPGQEASTGSYPGQPNPASPDKPNEPHPYAGYQDATEAVSDVDAQQQPDAVVGAVGEDRQNTDENEVDYQFDSGQLADASEVAGQPKALERPRIKKASGDEKGVGIGG